MKKRLLILLCFVSWTSYLQAQTYLDLNDTTAVLKELFKIEGVKMRYNQLDKKSYNCGYWTADREIAYNIRTDGEGKYYVRWANTIPFKTSKGSFLLLCFLTGQHLGEDGFSSDPFQQSVAIVQHTKDNPKKKLVVFNQNFATVDVFAEPLAIRDNGNDNFVIEAIGTSTKGGDINDITSWYDIDSLRWIFSMETGYNNAPNVGDDASLSHSYKVKLKTIFKGKKTYIEAQKEGKKGNVAYKEITYYAFDEAQKKFVQDKK